MQARLALLAFSLITSPADLMLEQHCRPPPSNSLLVPFIQKSEVE